MRKLFGGNAEAIRADPDAVEQNARHAMVTRNRLDGAEDGQHERVVARAIRGLIGECDRVDHDGCGVVGPVVDGVLRETPRLEGDRERIRRVERQCAVEQL